MDKRSEAADVVVYYNDAFNKLTFEKIRVYDKNGKLVRKIKTKEVLDQSTYSSQMFDEGRIKYVDASYSEYPYTIEYEYVKSTKMTMFYPTWGIISDFEVAVEKSEFEIRTPLEIQVRHASSNIEVSVEEGIFGNQRIYKASSENILALVDEPMRPTIYNVFPYVVFAPDKFGIGEYKGDMSSWESLGEFNYELNKGRDELSEEMQHTVKKLVESATTKEEKIKILYQYLQENMRYVGIQLDIGGWQTFDAQYVEHNKYGDCKALTNFMKSMLKVAEVEAYAALIHNGSNNYNFTQDFSFTKFNHVILYVPDEKDGIWLECTSPDLPPGVIGSSNENRYALLIKPEGGELIHTPVSTGDDNLLKSDITITIAQDGTANIKATQKATGNQEGFYRYYARNESEEEIRKVFYKKLSLPSFKINHLELKPSTEKPETDIELDFEVPKYASRGGKRLFVSPNPINKFSNVPREMTDRTLPIENLRTFKDIDVVTVEIPNGYEVESIPQKDLRIDNDFGTYTIQFEEKENQLIYTRTMEVKQFSFGKERYEEYRQFLKEVIKADKMKVVLVRNQP